MRAAYESALSPAYPEPLHPSELPNYRRFAPVVPTSYNATPTPNPTPTSNTAPSAILRRSPLIVDSARGRLYASDARLDAVELSTYDADTGRRISTQPLLPGELLLDIGDAGELFVLGPTGGNARQATPGAQASGPDIPGVGWQVRVLDRTGDELRRFPVPMPDWADPALQFPAFPQKPTFPLVDRARGQVLAFSGPHVTVMDSATGGVTREFEVPPAGTHGSVARAALDQSGDTLYLAVADPGLGDWEGAPGVRLMALDWHNLDVLDQSVLRAELTAWIPTGDGVIASGYSYKMRGSDQRVWKKGREVARRTEAVTGWSAYDQKRHRAIGYLGGAIDIVAGDGESLDLKSVPAFVSRDLDPAQGGLSAYDPKTDHFYGRGRNPDQLVTVSAAAMEPTLPAALRAVKASVTPDSHLWARERRGPAQLIVGSFTRPLRLGEPTPDPSYGSPEGQTFGRAFSTDGGETWQTTSAPGRPVTAWPDGVVASPAFERDRTLFGYRSGLGVFRSTDAGVTWQPSSAGLGALHVREVILSPAFSSDDTLIAVAEDSYREEGTSASAWLSRDRGASWSVVGGFSTLAFSPDYARDKRILAFEDNRLHVSRNGGQTWGHVGSLGRGDDLAGRLWVIPATGDRPEVLLALSTSTSEMGGAAHWPESDANVYRSLDGGLTWTASSGGYKRSGFGGHLIGPLGHARSPTFLLQIDGWPPWAALSRDSGTTWSEVTVKGLPEALVLAQAEDGLLLVSDPEAAFLTVELDSLEPVPTETPPP